MRPILLLLCALACTAPAGAQAGTLPPAEPTDVEVGLYLVDITTLDERENTFGAELDVIASWTDPRRETDVELNLRGDEARAYLVEGWMPDMIVTNSVGESQLGRVHARILPGGRVITRARLTSTVRSALDFRDFPFDTQRLVLRAESFPFPRDQVRLVPNNEFAGFDPTFEMPEWEIVSVHETVTDRVREQEGREFSHLEYVIEIRRLSGYYLWKVVLPLGLIAAISWVVFWMSSDALGRRAGVSATGMLTVIAYQFIIAGSLPRFPYLTVLDEIALLVLVLISLTMLQNIVVSSMDEDQRRKIDRTCRVIFPVGLLVGFALMLGPVLVG